MKIRFWWNSFIEIEYKDIYLVCDPWINEIKAGYGWLPSQKYLKQNVLDTLLRSTYIYISHIHYDHLDLKLLKELPLLDHIIFLIPKLRNKHLFNKLSSISNINIVELEPYENYKLPNNLEVYIIPQIDSQSDSNTIGIDYDMDSSLIVKNNDDNSIFFNMVDNPLSPKSISLIREKLKLNKIDLSTLPCGSASQYPQSFLNIDRFKEKNKLNAIIFDRCIEKLNALECSYFVNAGGEYKIGNLFKELEQYKVILSPNQISLLSSATNSIYIDTDSEYQLSLVNGLVIKDYIGNFRIANQSHSTTDNQPKLSIRTPEVNLVNLFNSANQNLINSIAKGYFDQSYDFKCHIQIYSYKNIPIISNSGDYLTISNNADTIFKVNECDNQNLRSLSLHISEPLLVDCLTKKHSWNTAITSSSVLMQRDPNIFNPKDEQIFNFLTL